ncbi:MAG: ATP-binding protein [Planctomycetaceae bacterium]
MISESELLELMADLESFRVERTTSVNDSAKFSEAICAFANDLAGSGKPGYLLVGVDDAGNPSGLKANDELLRNLAGITSDGNILPAPAITAYKIALSDGRGDIAVVEVIPSNVPPVRYKGRVWIRRGPRKGTANEAEERILTERRTSAAKTFDAEPCVGSSLEDLTLELFTVGYRPLAVDAEVIAENERTIEQQLASLRFFDLRRSVPTNAGILFFAKDPLEWLPNAFVQFIQFEGSELDADIASERRFAGDLLSQLRELDQFIKGVVVQRPTAVTALREQMIQDYPLVAIRELLMNAVMHRAYNAASFIRFLKFSDRLEIQSPGPLYGESTPSNFPEQTSYRNPVIAEAMKVLGFVNRYGRGVHRAQAALQKNGNPPAEFIFGDTYFGVIIRGRA